MHEVTEQAQPDPDFPTVAFPNPEEPGALDLAAALADRVGADLVLANDPDADRLGVMVAGRRRRSWALSGNQIGALLGERVLATSTATTAWWSPPSSRRICWPAWRRRPVSTTPRCPPASSGWCGPASTRPDQRFVFGFEEALGFSVDEMVRDKDGISAALRFAELAAVAKAEGGTVWASLEALARRHGEHATRTWSWRADGPDGQERLAAAMDAMRARPPTALAGVAVGEVRDLRHPDGSSLPPMRW